MDIYKLKDLSHSDRMNVLESENTGMEDQTYIKPLTDQEASILKDELVQNFITKGFMDDEFSEMKAEYKEKVDPIKEAISEAIASLKTKTTTQSGKVYKLADFENKMIHFVDVAGNVINSRMMKPEERQFHLTTTPLNQKAI